jgi:20S proteasome alpha/beta subunit
MTIGIGYKCWNGVVVAADTMIVIGQDVQEGTKLEVKWTPCGSFAFVNSSDDGNATTTLVNEICHAFDTPNVRTYRELGQAVKNCMTEWRRGFGGRKPPDTQLILGAKLRGQDAKLFLCDPPNTFVEKDDYVACGAGAAVTDPLYETLFSNNGGEYTEVQNILRRTAYLIYRAKKDNLLCGKKTDCAVVSNEDFEPTTVIETDMQAAEDVSRSLDFLLSNAAICALQDDKTVLHKNAVELGEMMEGMEGMESLRATQFHDVYGKRIKTQA